MAQILVIEDDRDVLRLITTILESNGHTITCASNGVEGIAAYRKKRADVVVTDIMMPEKDGVETIRELIREDPQAKIIAVTGYRGRFNRLPAAQYLGAQQTLVKPFSQSELLHVVNRVLASN